MSSIVTRSWSHLSLGAIVLFTLEPAAQATPVFIYISGVGRVDREPALSRQRFVPLPQWFLARRGLIRIVLEASAGAQETSALFFKSVGASSLLSPAGDVSVIICRADELQMLDSHHSIIDLRVMSQSRN